MASALTKSPRSLSKLPLSPRSGGNAAPQQLPSADALESAFGPSFSSQTIDDREGGGGGRPVSPTELSLQTRPLSPTRDSVKPMSTAPKTPPSHHYHEVRPETANDRISMPNFQDQQQQQQQHPPQHSSPSRVGGGAGGIMSAPLSPTNSVGNTSTSTMGTLRSAASPTAGGASAATRDQYRALTSTPSERKRTVAACRALRAQITQFEDAFIQMHGRPPKGAAERAPLASTYMQYREWKRAIRADAACRIQALCRGARARLSLTRSEDPRMAKFMMKHHRGGFGGGVMVKSPTLSPKPLKDLSIPLDMGGDDNDSTITRTRLETRTSGQRGDDGVEVEMIPMPSVSPNWRNRQQPQQHPQQQQRGSQQQQPTPVSESSSPTASQSHKSSSSRSRSSSSLPDVSVMSLAELQQRKRELKQQLKLYDMNFHKQNGRMPEKREKEPIRHLYESYNAYKNRISIIEKGEVQPGPGTAAFQGVTEAAAAAAAAAPAEVSPKAVSPTYNSGNTSPSQGHFKRTSSGGGTTASSDSVLDASSTQEDSATMNLAMNTPSTASDASSQDLASLKAEKATLHQMLRSYEKDFFRQHKRQVSSFADIRPVASQYRRYKEIKKAIAQKSSSGERSSSGG